MATAQELYFKMFKPSQLDKVTACPSTMATATVSECIQVLAAEADDLQRVNMVKNLCLRTPDLAAELAARINAWAEDSAPVGYYKMPFVDMLDISAQIDISLEDRKVPEFSAHSMAEVTTEHRNAEQVALAIRLFDFLQAKALTNAQQGHRGAWLTPADTELLGHDGKRHLSELVTALGFTTKCVKDSVSGKLTFSIHW